ncbi:hypothetical protein [Phaeobacter gallaeciensis]|uniref:hypothetical protein n=1 Tax=Phaeobacter gallaeciensis TaxID=60890 RepID=UPI000BBF8A03|nr:hypothetical protein [Phaeobacter gallaeciensis]ATF17513.1 hypothetical protein PhaeoP129_00860 [Phaeobacter gallaeciensis]ATF21622.1 hypothetical protein PhaeoP128_00860 [Phaeobacter gallaeciensis]
MQQWFARLLAIACLSVMPLTPATAGAWLQKPGEGFAATSLTLRRDLAALKGLSVGQRIPAELGYYGEYGLHTRWTVGVDLNLSEGSSAHALLFVRHPLTRLGRARTAVEVALGLNQTSEIWTPMQRLTLSYGRSFDMRLRDRDISGWVALDLGHEWRSKGLEQTWKLDATFGLNRPGKLAPLLQVETSKTAGDSFSVAVTPSLRMPLARRFGKDAPELVIGLQHKRTETRSLGIKLAIWHRF